MDHWTKAPNSLSAKSTKISSLMPYTAKVSCICEDLINGLQFFKDHLHHAHMLFKTLNHLDLNDCTKNNCYTWFRTSR